MSRLVRYVRYVAAFSLASAAILPLVRAEGGATPMPGPAHATPHHGSTAAENARCEACHVEIAAEWRASLHHRSNTDPVYRRAIAREPLAFCRGCHAPEANPDHEAPADLGALGVGCVSCHAAASGSLAAPRGSEARAPHGVVRSAAFATAAACASCHEFSFPNPDRRPRSELMQSTVSEHSASPFASMSCAACHMPSVADGAGRTHRSHAFGASHDAAWMRAAVQVRAARTGDGQIEIRLLARGVGHGFPTGDLFRRIEVRAEAVGAESNVVSEDVRYLARRFGKVAGHDSHFIKVMTADTRVSSRDEKVVSLSLGPEARRLPIAWRVAYQRVEHPIEDEKDAAVVEGEIELAAGVLR